MPDDAQQLAVDLLEHPRFKALKGRVQTRAFRNAWRMVQIARLVRPGLTIAELEEALALAAEAVSRPAGREVASAAPKPVLH